MKEGAVLVKSSAQEMALRAENIARRQLWGQAHIDIIRELGLTARQFEWTTKQSFYSKIMASLQKELYGELDTRFRDKMGDAQELAKRTSYESMEKLIDLMRSGASQTLQREAANDLIKYSDVIKVRQQSAPTTISAKQLTLITVALKEDAGRDSNGNAG